MIVIVGNKLSRDVIVTLVVMPRPRPEALVPEGTLYVLISARRETIDADTSQLGADGLKLDEAVIAPGGLYRKRGVPATAHVWVASDEESQAFSHLRVALTEHDGVKSCQVTVVAREPTGMVPGGNAALN